MDQSEEIARELVRLAAVEEFNLRQTSFRQRSALGERPYAENRSRSNSLSSREIQQVKRRFSDPGVGNSVAISANLSSVGQTVFSDNIIMAGTEVKIQARFIGRFREGVDAEKDRNKHQFYTVHRWLRDSENRISSKRITDDVGKIREACLAVHPDIGDAASMVHSDMLASITNWERFKAKCRLFWRSEEEENCIPALLTLIRSPPHSTHGETAAAYARGASDIADVVEIKPQLRVGDADSWKADRPNERLVSLQAMLLYISVTVFFGALPSKAQEILIKVIDDIKFEDEDWLTILAKFSEEMHKQRVSPSELSCMACCNVNKHQQTSKKGNNSGGSDSGKGGTQEKKKGKKNKKFKCFGCNAYGHFRKDCPDRKSWENKENSKKEN